MLNIEDFRSNIMLYNIKALPLHCVFHGIRFKVNEDWVSAIDTLLFLCNMGIKIKGDVQTPPLFIYNLIFKIFAP